MNLASRSRIEDVFWIDFWDEDDEDPEEAEPDDGDE